MDQILKGYVDSFSDERGYSNLEDSDKFEHFVNYCMVSKQYPRDFDLDSISVGGVMTAGLTALQ
ncbi:hypothetical protein ACFSHR_21230 [Azotobacter chroococcum]